MAPDLTGSPVLLPPPDAPDRPYRFAVVGSGWRASFFLRMARVLPERFVATAVVSRTAERGAEVTREWGVPTVRTVGELLDGERPDLVVTSTPWPVTPEVVRELVGAGMPVLAETPPAPDVDGLRSLWSDVGAAGLVQVAEHSPFMPSHAARTVALRAGLLGEVTQVQVSSTHEYHAMALIRSMLDAGRGPAEVVARRVEAPLVDPHDRAGWTGATGPRQAATTTALLDLGPGRSGLYDFTDNQWHNPLRENRLLVRGSHGELLDDRVTRWVDPRTVVTSTLVRRQSGVEQDLDGFDLDHLSLDGQVLYRNPYAGARLADDDIAVATLLDLTGAWARGTGPAPYPLAEGCQDHLLGRAVLESARTGAPVHVDAEAWATG